MTTKLSDAIKFANEVHPLPRCRHDSALQDGAGEKLEPPCGCRLPTKTNEQLIEAHAEKIAVAIQAAVHLSDDATRDLKWCLVEFAEEIKRQAIEP